MATIRNLREAVASAGVREVAANIMEALRLPDDNANRLRAADFPSIRYLFEAFTQRPAYEMIREGMGFAPLRGLSEQEIREAEVGVSAFKQITTQLISSELEAKYNSPDYIWRELVTEQQENRRDVKVAGLEGAPEPGTVKPGATYPVLPFATERYSTAEQIKKGLIIEVNEDVILEDQTGQLLGRARDVGEIMADDKESRILDGVQDVNSTVFQPQGSAEALYRTSAGTNSSRVNAVATNALADWTDIDNAKALFAAFTKNRDGTGKRIVIPQQMILLVPSALESTAHRVANATEIEYDALSSGTGPITRASNPYRGRLRPLSSNLLDAQSTSTWYVGAFKKQFRWFYKWLLRVLEELRQGERWFEADVVLRVRASEYGEVSATDDAYVVKSTA